MLIAIEAALAVVAGILAGVTGGGGGIIFVPLLLALGLTPTEAVAASNVSILITTLAGTVGNLRRGPLPWRRVLLIALGALACAPLGAYLALRLPGALLLVGLIALNIVNFIVIGRRARRAAGQLPGDPAPARATAARELATGGVGGGLAGLFGVGGGIVMVPLMVGWLRMPVRLAARVSLAVIIATSGGAILGFLAQGSDIDWAHGAILGLGGIVGAPIGGHILHRITARTATRILQAVIVVVTVSMVLRLL